MPSFSKDPSVRTPFGKNQYLRSTQDVKTESYTTAAASVPTETIDGATDQKVLQSGELMAKITSGPDAGKIGPFQADATDGRQTVANVVGINDTFLPWQLMERDVETSAVYEASLVQAWCFERNAAGARIPLSNATRDAILALPQVRFRFS